MKFSEVENIKPDYFNSLVVNVIDSQFVYNSRLGTNNFIPHLMVDSSARPDIDDWLKAHEDSDELGDIESTWESPAKKILGKYVNADKRNIYLRLESQRPLKILFLLKFNIANQGDIVESINNSGAIQIHTTGTKESSKIILNSGVTVEIPDRGFQDYWSELWFRELVRKFKKSGSRKSDAKTDALAYIQNVRVRLSLDGYTNIHG